MSLINDALRQARQANPTPPSAEGPVLQAVAPTIIKARQGERWAVLLLGMLLTLGGMFIWQSIHPATAIEVRARTKAPDDTMTAGQIETPASTVEAAPKVSTPAAETVSLPEAKASEQPSRPVEEPVAAGIKEDAVKQEPTTYKLQSIIFRPRNPSALINGKDVNVGSKVDGATVVAIGKASVTLVDSLGQTNVLEVKFH